MSDLSLSNDQQAVKAGDSHENPLGIYTNMVSPPTPADTAWADIPLKTLRYIWQGSVRKVLPKSRVHHCLRTVKPGADRVEIMHSQQQRRANYRNLIVCGSIWHCPVCAARISEHRRKTLSSQLARLAYQPILVTYTVRHNRESDLRETVDLITDAKKQFRQGKAWQKMEERYGLVAAVRALEVTHGDNGWHPHMHELVLLRSNLGAGLIEMTERFKQRWSDIVARLGGNATLEHGLDVAADIEDVGDYVAKIGKDTFIATQTWKLEREVTKAVVKMGRNEGRTPNQLLHEYTFNSDLRAGMLWKEYAEVFKGRKQLVPSSFAALLGEEEEPDDEVLAELQDSDAVMLAWLSLQDWQIIKAHEYRGQLLEVAERGDFDLLADFLRPMGIDLQPGGIS